MVGAAGIVDELVARHRALAHQQAAMLLARVPRSVQRGDLESAAMLGLFQAAQAWAPERGVSFEVFARHRIRGALLDELRGRDWASRRTRTLARNVAAVHDELSVSLGRSPTDDEVAARLGITVERVTSNTNDIQRAALRSSDVLGDESLDIEAPPSDDPAAVFEGRERSAYVQDAVRFLPARLRRVIVGYYVEELPMATLAVELGVTESRVSQMRAEAVRILRAALTGVLDVDDVPDVAFGDFVSTRALPIAAQLTAQAGSPRPRARAGSPRSADQTAPSCPPTRR